jgi:hypothetical protein
VLKVRAGSQPWGRLLIARLGRRAVRRHPTYPPIGQIGDTGQRELNGLEPPSRRRSDELIVIYADYQKARALLIPGQGDVPASGRPVAGDANVRIADAMQPDGLRFHGLEGLPELSASLAAPIGGGVPHGVLDE